MDSSPLSLLPAELRNEIYRLALTQSEGVDLEYPAAQDSDDDAGCLQSADMKHLNLTALLYTCKQINNEARTLIYANNIFILHTAAHAVPATLACFTAQIDSDNRKRIPHIKIDIGRFTPELLQTTGTAKEIVETLWSKRVDSHLSLCLAGPLHPDGRQVALELDFKDVSAFRSSHAACKTAYAAEVDKIRSRGEYSRLLASGQAHDFVDICCQRAGFDKFLLKIYTKVEKLQKGDGGDLFAMFFGSSSVE